MQVTGTLIKIKNTETIPSKTGGKDFSKREFWLELDTDPKYPQTVSFELSGDKTDIIDAYQEGQKVEVEFNLRGRIWNDKCFNTLSAWKIQPLGDAMDTIQQSKEIQVSGVQNTELPNAFMSSGNNEDLPW